MLSRIATALALSPFSMLVILAGLYPMRPDTWAGWIVLFVISVPIVLVYGILGEMLFSPGVSMRTGGRVMRLLYGIAIGLLVILVSRALIGNFEPWLGSWSF